MVGESAESFMVAGLVSIVDKHVSVVFLRFESLASMVDKRSNVVHCYIVCLGKTLQIFSAIRAGKVELLTVCSVWHGNSRHVDFERFESIACAVV